MGPLVSVDWLESHLDRKDLIILDASPPTTMTSQLVENEGKIIPHARRFDLKNIFSNQQSEYPNTIPFSSQFEKECRNLGINKESRIVIYDNLGIYTSPRAWWLFKVMGHDTVSVLDGGLPAWMNNGNSVTDIYHIGFKAGDFVVDYNRNLVKSYEEVKNNIISRECLLIDARSNERFTGSAPEPRKHLKSGSIDHSLNLPYGEVLENGKYKSINELKQIFAALKIGDQDLIFSCGSGMTACIILLASHLVSENKTFLFDGSWTEWAMKEGLLLEEKNNKNKNKMKTMTCKQLGGACDQTFTAATFDEMAEMSKQHGMEMFKAGDESHLDAMSAMRELMHTEGAMERWMQEKRDLFESL